MRTLTRIVLMVALCFGGCAAPIGDGNADDKAAFLDGDESDISGRWVATGSEADCVAVITNREEQSGGVVQYQVAMDCQKRGSGWNEEAPYGADFVVSNGLPSLPATTFQTAEGAEFAEYVDQLPLVADELHIELPNLPWGEDKTLSFELATREVLSAEAWRTHDDFRICTSSSDVLPEATDEASIQDRYWRLRVLIGSCNWMITRPAAPRKLVAISMASLGAWHMLLGAMGNPQHHLEVAHTSFTGALNSGYLDRADMATVYYHRSVANLASGRRDEAQADYDSAVAHGCTDPNPLHIDQGI